MNVWKHLSQFIIQSIGALSNLVAGISHGTEAFEQTMLSVKKEAKLESIITLRELAEKHGITEEELGKL